MPVGFKRRGVLSPGGGCKWPAGQVQRPGSCCPRSGRRAGPLPCASPAPFLNIVCCHPGACGVIMSNWASWRHRVGAGQGQHSGIPTLGFEGLPHWQPYRNLEASQRPP